MFDAVMVRGETAQWNPWHDNAYAVSVGNLMEESQEIGYDFSPIDEDGEEMYAEAIDLALDQIPEQWDSSQID